MATPLVQPSAIVRWLRRQGFTVKVKPNGMPLVSRSHFESLMSVGGNEEEQKSDDMTTMPDAAALIARFQKSR